MTGIIDDLFNSVFWSILKTRTEVHINLFSRGVSVRVSSLNPLNTHTYIYIYNEKQCGERSKFKSDLIYFLNKVNNNDSMSSQTIVKYRKLLEKLIGRLTLVNNFGAIIKDIHIKAIMSLNCFYAGHNTTTAGIYHLYIYMVYTSRWNR